jgi:hypothetical protein
MHAALDVNTPNYASAIVTTDEIVDSISSLYALGFVEAGNRLVPQRQIEEDVMNTRESPSISK